MYCLWVKHSSILLHHREYKIPRKQIQAINALSSKDEREKPMFTSSISSSRADLKENDSWLLCCFCGTISNININPSLAQCGTSPPQRDPQCTESAGHLQTWCDMEPADHLAGEQSQSPWKKGRNISWLLSRVQSLQNTETTEDSPYQQSPNGGHLHSDLHRRTRHEGLLPTNKRILEVIKDFFTKEDVKKDQSAWEHPLCINSFSES